MRSLHYTASNFNFDELQRVTRSIRQHMSKSSSNNPCTEGVCQGVCLYLLNSPFQIPFIFIQLLLKTNNMFFFLEIKRFNSVKQGYHCKYGVSPPLLGEGLLRDIGRWWVHV